MRTRAWPRRARRVAVAACVLVLCSGPAALAAPPGVPPAGTPGAPVASFGSAAPPQSPGLVVGPASSSFRAVAYQGDGKVVAAGQEGSGASGRLLVARYTPAGTLDPGFGSGGLVRGPAGSYGVGVAVRDDGRLVVGGGRAAGGLLAMGLNPNGTPDGTFGSGGTATALTDPARGASASGMTRAPDGSILVAGTASPPGTAGDRMTVARFTAAGAVDGGFGTAGVQQITLQGLVTRGTSVAVQADGHVVVGGAITDSFGGQPGLLARLSAAGGVERALVKSMARNGSAFSEITSVANGPDGGIVVGGTAANLSSSDFFVSRLNAAGDGGAGATTQWLAAPQNASVTRTPAPGTQGIVATRENVYAAGIVDSGGFRLIGLTALNVADGQARAGFGASPGQPYQGFLDGAFYPGTTYTYVDGAGDNPYQGRQGEAFGVARSVDGTRLAVVGVTATSLSGSSPPPDARGIVAVYEALPEAPPPVEPPTPVPPGPGQPPTVRFPAKLEVLRAQIKGSKLDVLASTTGRATGEIKVTFVNNGVTKRYTAKISSTSRLVKITRTLPAKARRGRTGILTLTYNGNDRVRSDDVRLRAASHKALLKRTSSSIDSSGNLLVAGTISQRARGVVRIRMDYTGPGGDERTLTFRATIKSGKWSLKQDLPEDAATAGGELSIQFTGYLARKIRGEQTVKQVTGTG